jgi:hypothetical protein
VKAGLAQAQPAEAEPVEADLADAVPVQAAPVEAEAVTAEAAEGKAEREAEGQPVAAKLAEAGSAEELAEAELAEELAEAELEEELAEGGGQDRDGQDWDGQDWDGQEESRNVSPLAVAGIVVGVLALIGVAVGVLAVITHGFRPKTVVTYRPAAVFGLRPGECVNSGTNGLSFTVLSCATPHDAEVFARFSLPASAWPGAAAVQQDAGNGCAIRLGGYLNPQLATADLTQEYVYPNQAAWQAGERTVVCEVRSSDGQLTGSVRAKS